MSRKPYVCEACGAFGVKLWRMGNCFCIELKCKACATKEQAEQIAQYASHHEPESDQIGDMLPAVPDEFPDPYGKLPKHTNYWGYTSVPSDWCAWWAGLPEVMGESRKTVTVDWNAFALEFWTLYNKHHDRRDMNDEQMDFWRLLRRWRKGTP